MYKVDLPVDDSKDKVVEARRSAERARKARFFNPRLRVMGLDLDALNQQVLENKHKRSYNLQRRQDELFLLQDSNEKEKRKALQKELNHFWDSQQQMKISHDVEVKGQYNLTIPESELGPSSLILCCSTQAEVRALDRREQRRNEAADNLVEIWHAGTSDMLTETAEPAETYLGGGRPPHVLPDKWRGMSLAQLNHFHEQREQQRLEKKKQLEADKIRDAAWDLQLLKISKAGEEKDQKMAELRRQQRILMDQENKQLARLQQAHQHYLNKELYTYKPTRDYFDQFNTGCR
uniref:RIB43A-like with coiled-coils protein 1 n=1 Tax=Poecilia reticulata TaxID=8081 RepID=A0A3P9QDG9_POERE